MSGRRIHKIRHDEETRAKIQGAALINRLQGYAQADRTDKDFKKKEMDSGQVRAALGLLDKVLPSLKDVELSFDPDSELNIRSNDVLTGQLMRLLTRDQLMELKKIHEQAAPPADNDKPR